ncbi:MAG TPA: hypothetical protein VHN77_13375, partial [Phycisphaerales bacterium]|nr:hypothetical protein [Phycisphaerales bacterium]
MRTPYSAEGVEWCARGVLRAAACIAVVAVGAWKLNAQTMTVRGFMDFYDTGTAARTMASVGTIRCSYYQPVAVGGSASDGWTFTPAGEALVGDAAANMMPLIAWEVSDGATVYNTMIASVVEWRGDFDIRGYDTSLRIGLVPGDASTEAGRVYVGSRTRTDSGTAMGWRTFPESSCRFGIQYGCLSGSEHTGRAGPIFPFVVATKPDACGSGYSPCSPLDTWVAAGIVASPVTDDSDNARNLGAAQWTGIHSATDPGTTLWQTMYWGSPICIGIRFENSGTNEITVYSSTGF